MSLNESVKGEEILSGFASLHQAMSEGFDRMQTEFNARFDAESAGVNARFDRLENDVARLEHRVLRRFDDIDERLVNHEVRITALEARVS